MAKDPVVWERFNEASSKIARRPAQAITILRIDDMIKIAPPRDREEE